MDAWLSRLRHDLGKRAVWSARDLREAGREPGPADMLELRAGLFELRDGEGRVVSARELWQELCREGGEVPFRDARAGNRSLRNRGRVEGGRKAIRPARNLPRSQQRRGAAPR